MILWKIVSGFGAIAGGMATIIIILAVCIWMVAGVINWLLRHSFTEVFGGEQGKEFEVPYTKRIPTPPPMAKPRGEGAADFRIYADVVAAAHGAEIWPKEVWVVDNGWSKVAWSNLGGAIDSIPDGKSFIVFDGTGKTIQYGTKNSLVAYKYPF